MNGILFNTFECIIEFVKLFLVVVVLFRIKQSKNIYLSFAISLFMVMFVSVCYDLYEPSSIFAVVSIFLLTIHAHEKRKAGIIFLSYIGISVVDMLFACIGIVIFRMDMEMIEKSNLIDLVFNSCSLVVLVIISLIIYKKRLKYDQIRIKKYLPIYLIGGISLSLYLTAVQFMGLGEAVSTYRNVLVWGLSLSSLVLIAICVLLIVNSNENEHLKREAVINENLLESQKEYYMMLLKKENETKAFRHDIRKHIYCMNILCDKRDYDELAKYLSDMSKEVGELSSKINTGNGLISAIVNDIAKKYPSVELQWEGMMPEEVRISSLDMCTIFYNLISNAFEAAEKTDKPNVSVRVGFMETVMMITIVNTMAKQPKKADGQMISSKTGEGHGYGIRNARKSIEKYQGSYHVTYDENTFETEIILPNVL